MSEGLYAYKERVIFEQDLDELRERVIRNLYAAAVKDGRYPVAKPKLTLQPVDRFGFDALVTIKATVETL